MSEPKPFASLGPSLLARKGGARPAMRPQYGSLAALTGNAAHALEPELEDLGWNDMGEDEVPQREAEILALTPEPANPEAAAKARADDADARARLGAAAMPAEPEIRHQQRRAAKALDALPRQKRRSAFEQGRRAAFTLRLDTERHLRLRLAATVQGRSAQQLVTEALDRFLAGIPELDGLAVRARRD